MEKIDTQENNTDLILLNKYIHPVQKYKTVNGVLKGETHFKMARKHLDYCQSEVTIENRDVERLGIKYPSDAINFRKIRKIEFDPHTIMIFVYQEIIERVEVKIEETVCI